MTGRPGILITGASRRIGAILAKHFAAGGYNVALHYHTSKPDAEHLQRELSRLVTCKLFRQDLSDIAVIPEFIRQVKESMPECVALVNNASVFERSTFLETDEALFDRQFITNFKAPFFLTQAFAKAFGKGSVINILDTDVSQSHASHFAYLLSKKALADFTLMAARALGPDIRVNGICPGYVLPHSEEDAEQISKIRKTLPLKAHGTPDDVAATAYWLCRQAHITGQILYVDGGKHVL